MLKIRLSRIGRKHEPVYRLVLVESTEPARTGNAIEVLGHYDSRRGEKAEFKADRITHWISKGAQVSDTAHNLLVTRGIIKGTKRNVLARGVIEAAHKKAEPVVPAEPVVETPVSEPVAEVESTETNDPVEAAAV